MNQTYSRAELDQLSYAELKKLSAELEKEGAQIKKTRHYFIDEFWRRLGDRPIAAAELSDGDLAARRIGNKPILFAKAAGKFCAFDDRCPHKGFPLHKGSLDGRTLTCAYHGGKFDVQSGACLKHPYETLPCESFAVVVANDGSIECK